MILEYRVCANYEGGQLAYQTDGTGTLLASFTYDSWGNLTTSVENIPNANGWVNPYRFDGRDGVRYDSADGLNWMAVRAYDLARLLGALLV